MANIMSLKSLRNKPSRNGFDLSFKKNFTAKAGELLPIMVKEVLPGDSFQIDLRSFTRTQPINTAAFARMREYYDFFFVPYDLLWNKANTVLTQMYDNPQHALSIDPTQSFQLTGEMPYITAQSIANYLSRVQVGAASTTKNYFGYSRAKLSAKLLEYLGYGNFEPYTNGVNTSWSTAPLMSNLQFNAFGLLAYQKIYADFYRDSQWERISPSTFNVDYLGGTGSMQLSLSATAFTQNYNLFDLRYCNWQKDLFHGVVPNPQYGETASVPVTVTAATETTPASAAFDVVLLRQYEFLQKWKEIAQSGNKDYKEQVEKHWNVSVGDGYSELCTYLGGSSSSIDINEVVNTNITSDNTADIVGKGVGVSNGKISFNSNGKYGLLMCIYHCLPLLDYTTDFVDPAFTKVNSADYAIPEFDRVGMQGVPFTHMTNPLKSVADASNLILGYAPRYIDYKTSFDCSVGAFKNSLSSWVMSYGNQSVVNQLGTPDENNRPSSTDGTPMNYTYFKVNPNSVNPIFAVEADDTVGTDQFLCSTFFDVKVVRNLDTDGLPY